MKQYKCSCPQHSIRERVPSWSPYQPLSKPLAHAPYRFCEMPISTDLHSLLLLVSRRYSALCLASRAGTMLHLATLGGAAISDPTQFSFGKADRPAVNRAAPLLFFDSQCGNGTGSPSSHVWALAAAPSIPAFGYASCRDMRAGRGGRVST